MVHCQAPNLTVRLWTHEYGEGQLAPAGAGGALKWKYSLPCLWARDARDGFCSGKGVMILTLGTMERVCEKDSLANGIPVQCCSAVKSSVVRREMQAGARVQSRVLALYLTNPRLDSQQPLSTEPGAPEPIEKTTRRNTQRNFTLQSPGLKIRNSQIDCCRLEALGKWEQY